MLDLRYKTILGVALPMMVSGFIQSIVMITDSAYISRFSTEAFVAVGNSGLLYVTMFMCLIGMADGAQIIIARRIGEERPEAIGRVFGTAVITHFFIALVLFVVLYFIMPDAILYYSKDQQVAALQGDFIQIRSFALFFAMITVSIQAFFMAKGKTWVVLIAALITAISNMILGYGLILGNLGLPKLGVEGAAIASTLADGLGMLFLLVYLSFSEEKRIYRLYQYFSFNVKSMIELLSIGSPLMLQGFFALGTWSLFFAWLEQKGQFDLAVSQNIRSIYFLAFVPIWGFAGTTKTYISQYLGHKSHEMIPIIQRRIQLLTVGFLFITFHGALLYPENLIKLINPEEQYIEKSAAILRLVSVSILLFGLVSVYFQTIHGSGNTLHSMIIEFLTVGIYAIFSYLFIKVWDFDIYWVWTVEYIYFGILGIFSISYLRLYNWKIKEV